MRLLAAMAVVLGATLAQAHHFTVLPVVVVEGRQVTIGWETSNDMSTELAYGPTPGAALDTTPTLSQPGQLGKRHSVTLRRLPMGHYWFHVRGESTDKVVLTAAGEFDVERADMFPLGDWSFNGPVRAVTSKNNVWYFGGDFTTAGITSGGVVPIDSGGSLRGERFPEVNGDVYAITSDGVGGYFIGGRFTFVGGLPRTNLAHLLPDLGVDPVWRTSLTMDAPVRALWLRPSSVLSSARLYVGGEFSSHLAGIDPDTGSAATSFDNLADGPVYALAVSIHPSILYVGGSFQHLGGKPVVTVGALNLDTGAGTAFSEALVGDATVYALTATNTTLYVGGSFSGVGATSRPNAAAFDLSTGTLAAWHPAFDRPVRALLAYDGRVYAGGDFQQVGTGSTAFMQPYLARVDETTGDGSAWPPLSAPDGPVRCLGLKDDDLLGTELVVGGDFTQPRRYVTAYFLPSSQWNNDWVPMVDGPVHAVAIEAGGGYLGGAFRAAGTVIDRGHLAAIDGTTGELERWSPTTDGGVWAITTSGEAVYVGGAFVQNGGGNVAGFTLDGGEQVWPIGMLPYIHPVVRALKPMNASTMLMGSTLLSFRAADIATGMQLPGWSPPSSTPVFSLAVTPTRAFVGGQYATGAATAYAFDSTGGLLPWAPAPNGDVEAIGVGKNNAVYLGGTFTFVNTGADGGLARKHVAAVDADGGSALPWNPDPNAPVHAIAHGAGWVYLGGAFTALRAPPALVLHYAVALHPGTGGANSLWTPQFDREVFALSTVCGDGGVAAGGAFTTVGAAPRGGFALLEDPSPSGCTGPAISPIDGGPYDAGAPDAGPPDAGEADAGELDAGEPDAGEPDAGETDAGELDAGELDAGEPDAGELDAGELDAGELDAGALDSGLLAVADAGLHDAGCGGDGGTCRAPMVAYAPCGCSTPGAPLLGLLGAWVALRGLRRRR